MLTSTTRAFVITVLGLAGVAPCDIEPLIPRIVTLEGVHPILTAPTLSREEFDVLLRRTQEDLKLDNIALLSTLSYRFVKGISEGQYKDEKSGYRYIVACSILHDRMPDIDELTSGLSLLTVKEDPVAQYAAWNVMELYEEYFFSSKIDFAKYEEYVRSCFNSGTRTSQVLIDYLFQRNAVDTLDFVLKFGEIDEDRRGELTRANDIAREFYPKDNRTVRRDVAPTPEELALFHEATAGDEWWLPLYFAEVVRKVYAFQTEEVLARLRAIDHPVVKEALRAIEVQDPEKPVPLARWMALQERR